MIVLVAALVLALALVLSAIGATVLERRRRR